jgi:hypothetical protein
MAAWVGGGSAMGAELLFFKGKKMGLALPAVGVGPLLMRPTISLLD